jgi:dienelactone hydrolase
MRHIKKLTEIMKNLIYIFSLLTFYSAFGQNKTPEDFGYRHIVYNYKNESVDILVKSKKGEENVPKPIFIFCQGSLPIPLIIYDGKESFGTFPFNPDSISKNYHLVIIGKPSIPLIADVNTLQNDFTYLDSTGRFPKTYIERNLLSYYVPRNIAIIKYLRKQNWVSKNKLIIAGHSEGSTIAVKIATEYNSVTHLIYSGGNPLGRILSIIQQSRAYEIDSDSTRYGEASLKYWSEIVANKNDKTDLQGDTYKGTYEFSEPMITYLDRLKIPVLVSYGTKDWSSPYNDYLRVDMMRKNKTNFSYNAYIGMEHNYFPLTNENKPNYEIFNWDRVANDWLKWLNEK